MNFLNSLKRLNYNNMWQRSFHYRNKNLQTLQIMVSQFTSTTTNHKFLQNSSTPYYTPKPIESLAIHKTFHDRTRREFARETMARSLSLFLTTSVSGARATSSRVCAKATSTSMRVEPLRGEERAKERVSSKHLLDSARIPRGASKS